MKAIEIRGLVKRYDEVVAVDHLDLDVEEGAFFGLLGPNGAGKTTTIGTLVGLVRPTAGSVKVFGHDAWKQPDAARRAIGLCPQEPNFDDFLGLEQILAYHGGFFGMPYGKALDRARELLRFFDLYDRRHKRTSTLSGGMKRRLLLARAVMHKPRLLVLDEPTAGVDVEIRRGLWEYVQELNEKESISVLLTTHYLEEAEALCEDLAVIDHGRIVERGHPDALRNKYGVRRVTVTPASLPPGLDPGEFGFHVDDEGRCVLEATDPTQPLRGLLRALDAHDVEVEDLEVARSRLEDVFVRLTSGADQSGIRGGEGRAGITTRGGA